MGVDLLYNVLFVSAVHTKWARCVYRSPASRTSSPPARSPSIQVTAERGAGLPAHTVGPHGLSVLRMVVCTCQSHPPPAPRVPTHQEVYFIRNHLTICVPWYTFPKLWNSRFSQQPYKTSYQYSGPNPLFWNKNMNFTEMIVYSYINIIQHLKSLPCYFLNGRLTPTLF